MQLRLTVLAGGQRDDVVVTTDATATVGDLTERIRVSHPRATLPQSGALGLTVGPGATGERVVGPATTLADAGIRSGDVVNVTAVTPSSVAQRAPAATLHVVAGPGAPATFPLHRGTNVVGRDHTCDVRLSDPLVSKRHAKINVTDQIELIDDSSANGILISNQVVDRAVLRAGDVASLGDSVVSVALHAAQGAADDAVNQVVAFNRSPRLDPVYEGISLKAPQPPKPPQPARFPFVMLAAPIMMAGMIYAVTRNPLSILFVALSPMMMIGSYVENRRSGKKALETGTASFRSALIDLSIQLQYAQEQERAGRLREHPSVDELLIGVDQLSPLVWTRRPEHESFLRLRLGLGTRPSRNSVEMPASNETLPELWRELEDVASHFATVDRVPAVADLRDAGNLGVAGPDAVAASLTRGVLAQIAGLHSPSELVITGLTASSSTWEWLKWLPHVGSEFSPLECDHLASNSAEANVLVSALEELIAERAEESGDSDRLVLPVVIVFVCDDAPAERSRLVQLAERGPASGVHVVWHAASEERLPAACRVFIGVDPNTGVGRAGYVRGGEAVEQLELGPVDEATIERFSRRLAPVVDSGAKSDDETDLPRTVSLLALTGPSLAASTESVLDLWRENNSLPFAAGAPRRRRLNSLRALVGQGAAGPLHLDLRAHGPHALVGGTTGAGKSEFLQSWILGMAAMHSPSRVAFLFVDYKGGAAFAECVDLPHCVGLVTDLSPHLVRRSLTSLNAELRHREHVLNAKKAKDLFELEKRNDPDTPPSLVIVVDEFAALVTEVPEFVDGVVNVAQRGRSLGLHLILATQRPAGVIKDNLRANTNLRVALRMADEADSTDVVGTSHAADFDPGLPGRGVVKTGPGRLTAFQSAYVGGHTRDEPQRPPIVIVELRFGVGETWDEPDTGVGVVDESAPTDIRRMVDVIGRTSAVAEIPRPRKPWLPELAATYRLEALPTQRTDNELVFGVQDDPEAQAQPEVAFFPDRDGNMAVYGTGGSGKSTFLRSLAVAAAWSSARGGPCWVYGLDFGSRGLQMLEVLPHVGAVISGDDNERIVRLLRWLSGLVDDRSARFAGASADTIEEFRRSTGVEEARIVVMVDGVGAFRQGYEGTERSRIWDQFQAIAADGRSVGIHIVVTGDRPAAVSPSLSSVIQRRLVLRLASENDYATFDTPKDAFDATTPPGRGFVDGTEIQVGVIGGHSNVARQTAELARLASSMERAGIAAAPPVERLSDHVERAELPAPTDAPLLGISDADLEPIPFPVVGTFLVAGPPQSGKTTTVASMLQGLHAVEPGISMVHVGPRRSPLHGIVPWSASASDAAAAAELARDLVARIADEPGRCRVLVIESIGDLLNSEADIPLQELIKACRANDRLVIAEGETSTVNGSWPLLHAVKAERCGIVMQPDQLDGDMLFKVGFPRINRAEYPPGRGLHVRSGQAHRVQVAMPE